MSYFERILRSTGILPKKKSSPSKKETEEGIVYKIVKEEERGRVYVRIGGLRKETEFLTVPAKIEGIPVEVLGKRAFADHTALKKVVLPDSIGVIGKACFEGCVSLESINVPGSLEKIFQDAFKGCKSLSDFDLPADLEHIGKNAFQGTGIKSGTLKGYTQVFTVGEVCALAGVALPEDLQSMKDTQLVNLACHPKFAEEGGAYIAIYPNAEDLAQVLAKHPKLVVIDESYEDRENLLGSVPCIRVADSFEIINKIIADIRARIGFHVVGITGSIGKTTTKELVFRVLNEEFKTARGLGNENTIYPLFNNMQKVPEDLEFFVQEYGMGEPGSLGHTVDACIPDAGVITSISMPHIELYGSMENILREKRQMIDKMAEGTPVFLCSDFELLKTCKPCGHPVFYYAMEEDGDFQAKNIKENDGVICFDACTGGERLNVELNLFGTYNVNNALCAYAVGKWAGVPDEKIRKGISGYSPSARGFRQNYINIGGQSLYLDCYNSTPDSLVSAAEVLSGLPACESGRRIAVIGEFYMLVKEEEKEIHLRTAKKLKDTAVDFYVCYGGENAKIMADELGDRAFWASDRQVLNRWLTENTSACDTIMFKGCNAAMLFKSVDQVYGSFYHRLGHEKENKSFGDFDVRFIYETEAHAREGATSAVMKYTGMDAEVKIEAEYEDIPVFAVGPKAFDRNERLTHIDLPNGLVHIGENAFAKCKNLKDLTIPASVKQIARGAFRGCRSLSRLEIPEGVTEIGEIAFRNCKNLETVVIPGTVKNIGDDAFSGCDRAKFIINHNLYAERRIKGDESNEES